VPDGARPSGETLAREVDRLLKKLPGAEPAPAREPISARAPVSTGGLSAGHQSAPTPVIPSPASVWGRTFVALIAAAGVPLWPYARTCGWPLYAYLGAVAAVMIAAGWAGVSAWRGRRAVAHVVALILFFWGVVLAAEQVLPRIGYAAAAATWSCNE
jgi:hypothetical protein